VLHQAARGTEPLIAARAAKVLLGRVELRGQS
jgi:hypothetical protein